MAIRRLFGRKKKEEETKEEPEPVGAEEPGEEEPAPAEEAVADEPVEASEDVVEEPVADLGATIPYHDSFQDRLKFFFGAESGAGIEAPDEFMLEFMAMGERFHIVKKPMGGVEFGVGAISDEDAFIRVGQDVVQDLLTAATFGEFSEIFIRYYKNPDPGKFVKIELRKAMFDLNRRGYARVPILKLLTGQAR
ncbi:MAG: hypothetical protein ACW99U_07170 [Candidatus Thorarchaeota archaeon]|jgi:hypothetical protein